MLAAQDERRITIYRRTEHGVWRVQPDVYLDADSFELPSLTRSITVAEVYDDILDSSGTSLLR